MDYNEAFNDQRDEQTLRFANGTGRRYNGTSAIATFLRGGAPQNGYISGSLTGANKIVAGMEDPTYLAFQFIVDTSCGLFGRLQENDPYALLGNNVANDYHYTASKYLEKCQEAEKNYYGSSIPTDKPVKGEDESDKDFKERQDEFESKKSRASLMSETRKTKPADSIANLNMFINGFEDLCISHPYYLQSIEGLQDVYKKYFDTSKDPFFGGNDTKIKISCLESIDLRMFALFDAYFRAIWDRKFRRMLIPRNLQKFNCTVIVHDMRRLLAISNSDYKTKIENWESVEQNTSMIIFRFKNCVFDVDAIGDTLSGVSNADKTEAKFSFQFSYANVDIDVCSLADALQNSGKYDKLKNYRDLTDQNSYTKEFGSELNNPKKISELDFRNVYEGETGRGLFGTLMDFGQRVFNSTTSSSNLGNVYSDGAVGLVSNMLNSIGAGGFGSYLQTQGKEAIRDLGRSAVDSISNDRDRGNISRLTNGGKFNL